MTGQGAFAFTWYPEPFESHATLAYAVPDAELGAAQLLLQSSRSTTSGGELSGQSLGYAWGRRVAPQLSAGVQLRWDVQQATIQGLPSPQEAGLGLDAGLLYDAAPGLWLEAAVLDAFDTRLRSSSGTTILVKQRLFAGVTRQLRPDLALSFAGRDLTTDLNGATWSFGGRLERAGWIFTGEAGLGPHFTWSLAARMPRGRWSLRAVAEGTEAKAGCGLGVDVRW
ncbi:MAG: hypothetical protein ACM3RP_04250 [Chitinophagales bacterium]